MKEAKEPITCEDLNRIQELCDVKDNLVEALLSIDNRIDTVDIYPDYIILGFQEDVNIDTDLIVRLSETIHFTTFTISCQVLNKSIWGVMDYSTVRLRLKLDLKPCTDEESES